MRCGSMKAVMSSGENAQHEDIPPVFQQWHAAKVIEDNLGGHVRSSIIMKSSNVSMREVRDAISAGEVHPNAWHGVGWPHSTHDGEDSITSPEGRRPACGMTALRGVPFPRG